MDQIRSWRESSLRGVMARPLVAVLVAMFVVAACGPAATPTAAPQTPGATPGGTPGNGATPEPTERVGPPPGQADSFTVAFTSIGLSSLSLMAAIDELRAQGYTVETPEIAESELVTEGTAQGRFQFGSGANNATLTAQAQGAPLRWIVDRNLNEWTVGAVSSITECSGLAGARIAVHSPGAVSTAMIRNYIETNCPEVEFDPLIIAGSQNRLAALLAGQIDASPLELGDWIALNTERPGDFNLVANFAESLPELHTTSLYVNHDWAQQNPDVVKDLIREVLLQNRRIADEEGYLLSLLERYLPEEVEDEETAREITSTYRELGILPVNGGLTPEAVEYTIKFFGPDGTGSVDRELPADEVADLSYLQQVLQAIGEQ